jgi:putative SOS response-associated peptidase YedK
MTMLYRLDADAALIARTFDADPGDDPWQGGYVTPGRFAPVIVAGPDGARRLVPRLWGVPPPPGAAPAGGAPVVAHVRNLESPFWAGVLRHRVRRCLVPATGYDLWSPHPDPRTARHVRHRVALAGCARFAFAAIWRDDEVPGYALLRCAPNRLVGAVNPRGMPVILAGEAQHGWLNDAWPAASRLVAAFPSQRMTVDPPPVRGMDVAASCAGPAAGPLS